MRFVTVALQSANVDRLSLDEKRAHVTIKELRMYTSVGTLFQIWGPICRMLWDDANVRVLFAISWNCVDCRVGVQMLFF